MVKRRKSTIELPASLIEAVKSRRVVPFIGAGASKESRNAAGETPPDALQLRDTLAQQFFGKEMKNRDLMAVSEMAIRVSGGRSLVFEAVKAAFDGFAPSEAHRLLSAFSWRAMATTNFDLLLEAVSER
jgi:hypothetical protein